MSSVSFGFVGPKFFLDPFLSSGKRRTLLGQQGIPSTTEVLLGYSSQLNILLGDVFRPAEVVGGLVTTVTVVTTVNPDLTKTVPRQDTYRPTSYRRDRRFKIYSHGRHDESILLGLTVVRHDLERPFLQ